jgi:CDP-diacylglycerol--serine O-phosphatidyltransferase
MDIHKAKYILPNLFTLGSVALGLQAVVWAIEGRFQASGVAILSAIVMDMLDGRVARMTRTQSEFGMHLDSLADGISFGAAPALLVYFFALKGFRVGAVDFGLMVGTVYALCGILRLARFNVLSLRSPKPSPYFVGLPIPGGAAILALAVLAAQRTGLPLLRSQLFYIVATLALAALMVSTVRYPTFKHVRWSRPRVLLAGLLAALVLLGVKVVSLYPFLLLAACAFVAFGIIDTLVRKVVARGSRRRSAQSPDPRR